MTEHIDKLIERIAKEGAISYFKMWDTLPEEERDNWRLWARKRIYPLIKEALPELAKEAGYVMLAEDQSFPSLLDPEYDSIENLRSAGQGMDILVEEGWQELKMESKIKLLTKAEIKEILVKANCPAPLVDKIGNDLLIWWKTGWLQEILLAQKQAGMKEIVEWLNESDWGRRKGFDWQAKLKEWGL